MHSPYFHFRSRAQRFSDWVNVYLVAVFVGTIAALVVLGIFYLLIHVFSRLLPR